MSSWETIDGRLPRVATLTWGGDTLRLSNIEDFEDETQVWIKEVDGWLGGVDVHAENTQRTLSHGLFPAPSLRTGRTMTLEGYLFFSGERDRTIAERFISGILGDGEFGSLVYEVEGARALSSTVKLDGAIKVTYYQLDTLEFQIPLIAADPFLYGEDQRFQVYPAGYGIGLRYPLFGSTEGGVEEVISYGTANPNTKAVIENRGNATAYPLIRIVGDMPSGFVLHDSAGHTIEYRSPVWTQSPVEVNNHDGAIYQNNLDQSARATRRQWFNIPAGGTNTVRITALQSGDGYADIIHNDTYL
ncbi:hypothetical protein ACIGDM_10300 [Rothia koreensis]|uniref:hypothetical protein n=1 Tax=Rothia koreensis TaxID=592378 RepID=UPI0037CB0352